MTIEELLVYGKSHCHKDHAKILLAELLNKNPLELLNCLQEKVDEKQVEIYKKEILALKSGKPLQYVLKNVNFYGNHFYIDERVLIPRFETEELVEKTVNYIKHFFKEPIDIIDLGCGSGVIGLTLEKKVSTNSVDLIDISKDALEVAKINRDALQSKSSLIESDFFQKINKKYDVIISNPPYIGEDEMIEDIVKENEPSIALYAGKKGLDCYKQIIKELPNHMKDRCLIAFEIGNNQGKEIVNILNQYLHNVKIMIEKDLSNKDRMIFIFKNLE